jgi:hypothetical protein
MKGEVNALRQHPARLHRVRAQHFEQDAFNSNAVILEPLGITIQQVGSH